MRSFVKTVLALVSIAGLQLVSAADEADLKRGIAHFESIRDLGEARLTGSAIAVAPDVVLTASYLVDRADRFEVLLHGSEARLVGTVMSDPDDFDMVLVKVPGLNATPVSFAKDVFATGRLVMAYTAQAGEDNLFSTGSIGALERVKEESFYSHNAIITRLGYGGVLVNECFVVVGMNRPAPTVSRSRARRGVDPEGIVFAEPSMAIIEFLVSNSIEPQVDDSVCLTAQQRADAEAEARSKAEEEAAAAAKEAEEAQKKLDDAQAKLDEAQEAAEKEKKEAKVETDKAAAATEEAQKAADASAAAADAARKDLEATQAEAEQLEKERVAQEEREQLYMKVGVGAGVFVLLIVVLLIVRANKAKGRAAIAQQEAAAARAEATAASTRFDDCFLDGKDGEGNAVALKVSGSDLQQRGVIIGRSPDRSDAIIHDTSISRSHAQLEVSGSDLTIVDLDSTNGTKVNGRDARDATVLKSGDEILLGSVKLKLRIG